MKEEKIKLYLDNKIFNGTEEEFLAIEDFDFKEWKLGNKRHREDGPAVICMSKNFGSSETWYRHGKRHREDGHAFYAEYGYEMWARGWYKNGKLHREDGPALMRNNNDNEFYLDGKKIAPRNFKKRLAEYREQKEKLLNVQEDTKAHINLSFKPNEIDEVLRIQKILKEYSIVKSIMDS